jgi:outer membrane murein-binding lipoprotein Lpp
MATSMLLEYSGCENLYGIRGALVTHCVKDLYNMETEVITKLDEQVRDLNAQIEELCKQRDTLEHLSDAIFALHLQRASASSATA